MDPLNQLDINPLVYVINKNINRKINILAELLGRFDNSTENNLFDIARVNNTFIIQQGTQ